MKPNKRTKSAARHYALQALYQWQYTQESADSLLAHFLEEHDTADADLDYLKALVKGTIQESITLDEHLMLHIDRKLSQLSSVELVILRLATFELMHRPDVPYKVVINEAIELSKAFGAEGAHRYTNAVLDKLAPALRPHE